MFELLVFPITAVSVFIYLWLSYFHKIDFLLGLISLLVLILTSILVRKNLKGKIDIRVNNLSIFFWKSLELVLCFGVVGFIAFVLSPLVSTQTVNSFIFLQFPGVADYHKHIYVINALKENGLPFSNPYFPPATFSYYYGYYLIPAAFAKLVGISERASFYFFVIFTTSLSFFCLRLLYSKYIKEPFWGFIALLLLFLGGALDIIPTLIYSSRIFYKNDVSHHIESWSYIQGNWTNVNNIYTAMLWVPQHFFAAVVTILSIYHLLRDKPKLWFLFLSFSFVALSSTFVFITLLFGLFMTFLFYPQKRVTLIRTVIIGGVLLIPYIFLILERESLFQTYLLQPYEFISLSTQIGWAVNLFLSFMVDYGLLFISVPLSIFFLKKSYSKEIVHIFLSLLIPIVLTLFIRSSGINDFSMRFILPIQLIFPLFYILLLQRLSPSILKNSIFVLTIGVVLISGSGFFYEYYYRWKERRVFDYPVSQLMSVLSKKPSGIKLATIEKEDWVFYTPMLGSKQILSPYIFDSGVYFTKEGQIDFSSYSARGFEVFLNQVVEGKNLEEIIDKRNSNMAKMKLYFEAHPFDLLVIRNNIWVKKGINSWPIIFKYMGIQPEVLTSDFSAFPYKDLRDKSQTWEVTIIKEPKSVIDVKGNSFSLEKGLWFLASCESIGEEIKLAFEDYFLLYQTSIGSIEGECIGSIFYHPDNESILLENRSKVSKIYVFPVEVRPKL